MASLLLPGNPKRIDSCICNLSLIFKPVIDCHHLVQQFQKRLLFLQSIRKCVMLSVLLQYVHLLSGYSFILLSHSLQGNVLCIILYWNACIEVCQLHMKDQYILVYHCSTCIWSIKGMYTY